MSSPELKLVDLIPITTRPHTPLELALAQAGTRQLRAIRSFHSSAELIDAIIEEGGRGNEAGGAAEDALKAHPVYKQWQRAMPYLRNVPKIHRYRTGSSKDLSAVDGEILANGGFLVSGQILYHGGVLTSAEILTVNPISSSMHPSVAISHAIKDNGQLGVLRIGASNSVRAFAYETTGSQKLKHEYEVLLQGGLRLELTSERNVCGIQVKNYDVSLR